jgi:hypothetical protein
LHSKFPLKIQNRHEFRKCRDRVEPRRAPGRRRCGLARRRSAADREEWREREGRGKARARGRGRGRCPALPPLSLLLPLRAAYSLAPLLVPAYPPASCAPRARFLFLEVGMAAFSGEARALLYMAAALCCAVLRCAPHVSGANMQHPGRLGGGPAMADAKLLQRRPEGEERGREAAGTRTSWRDHGAERCGQGGEGGGDRISGRDGE